MRQFSMIAPAIWESDRFCRLGDRSKLLMHYYLTGPHGNSIGCFRLPDEYACADLRWPLRLYRETRKPLIEGGLVQYDPVTSEVLIERWFKHNHLGANPKHRIGAMKVADMIRSPAFQEIVKRELGPTAASASTHHLNQALERRLNVPR
jgi:hypothetical protein